MRTQATTCRACTSTPAHRACNNCMAPSVPSRWRGVPDGRNLQGALTGRAGAKLCGARGTSGHTQVRALSHHVGADLGANAACRLYSVSCHTVRGGRVGHSSEIVDVFSTSVNRRVRTESVAAGAAIFTALFQQGVGTRQGRSAQSATLTHNPPLVLRNACGSHRRPGLRAIAPRPFLCPDGARQLRDTTPLATGCAVMNRAWRI